MADSGYQTPVVLMVAICGRAETVGARGAGLVSPERAWKRKPVCGVAVSAAADAVTGRLPVRHGNGSQGSGRRRNRCPRGAFNHGHYGPPRHRAARAGVDKTLFFGKFAQPTIL